MEIEPSVCHPDSSHCIQASTEKRKNKDMHRIRCSESLISDDRTARLEKRVVLPTLSISSSNVVFCVSCDLPRFSFSRSCFMTCRLRSSTNFFVLFDFNSRTRRSRSDLFRMLFSELSRLLSSMFWRTWLSSRSFLSLQKQTNIEMRRDSRTDRFAEHSPDMSFVDFFRLHFLRIIKKNAQELTLFLGMLPPKSIHLHQMPLDQCCPLDILFANQIHELKVSSEPPMMLLQRRTQIYLLWDHFCSPRHRDHC